ncbi:P-loop containing nucleoside triphosphate hydrolase [Phytophthora cactorum]|nr:P-loop containing nucleoside triphosphate hydrolase [Phytophthora cactorum]
MTRICCLHQAEVPRLSCRRSLGITYLLRRPRHPFWPVLDGYHAVFATNRTINRCSRCWATFHNARSQQRRQGCYGGKLGVHRPPMQNSTRKRQKEELTYLRDKVQTLEQELETKRRELMTSKGQDKENKALTVQIRGRRGRAMRWQRIAKHQLVEKQRAELQNLQLRASLIDQIKLARSLQKLLKKNASRKDEGTEAAQLQARLEYSNYCSGVSEDSLYETLLQDMDAVYSEVNTICARHPVMQSLEEGFASMWARQSAELGSHEFQGGPVRDGGNLFGSVAVLVEGSLKLADGTYHGVASSPDTIRAKAITTLRVNNTAARMQMRFAMKKYVESGRVVITLQCASESEGPRDLLHGLKMMQRAWVVIRPVPCEPEHADGDLASDETIIQLCMRLTPSFQHVSLYPGQRTGAITELLLAAVHRNLGWLFQTHNMGNLVSQYLEAALDRMANYWTKPSRILLLGLDGAGKTTLLYKMKLGEAVTTIPTIGFNVETFQYKNIEFTAWDIGGQSKLRPLWRFYYEGADAVVFVIDSADRYRIDEASTSYTDDALRDCKLLVLANKQDHPGCMHVEELREKLALHRVTRNPSHISKTVAVSGQGVDEGMMWLSRVVTGK